MYRVFLRACLILAATLSLVPKATAQEVVWGGRFDFFFDNREYKSSINWPQTLFGARISPEIGIRWDDKHSIMAGASMLANFGAKPFETGNEAIAYYKYDTPKFKAFAGVVPRSNIKGDYSGAFFSDSIRYYDPNITGLLLQYEGGRGYFEFGCDWNSMITNTKREKFMLFSAGRLNLGALYGGYHFTMYHHAGSHLIDGVVDNVLIHPFVGTDLTRLTGMDSLTFQVGWINAFQNDRKYVNKYVTPGGAQIELRVEKWKFGIFNTLYIGKNLMPYYMTDIPDLDYGPGLYWGEPFYRTSSIYNRAEIYWQAVRNSQFDLRISSVHHYDGDIWGWQQKIQFSVNLSQRRIKNKN